MAKKEDIKFTFRLVGIELRKIEICELQKPDINIKEYSFEININAGVIEKEKKVVVNTNIETQNKEKTITYGRISVNCIYVIDNFDKVMILEKEKAGIPIDVSELLNIESYSTVRGVMWNEFKGTILHNAILPIIDPKKLIPNKTN